MIKVNGTVIATPSDYSVSINDISKAERNANGNMIIERIATKRTIDLSYKSISQTDLSNLLNAMSDVFFSVEYPDPKDGAIKTGTFYIGDRSAGAIDYINDVIRWKDIKFSLQER